MIKNFDMLCCDIIHCFHFLFSSIPVLVLESLIVTGHLSQAKIDGLLPYSNYVFNVQGLTENFGDLSVQVNHQTREAGIYSDFVNNFIINTQNFVCRRL